MGPFIKKVLMPAGFCNVNTNTFIESLSKVWTHTENDNEAMDMDKANKFYDSAKAERFNTIFY